VTALRELRAVMGVSAVQVAERLRINLQDLRTLESTPFRLLEVDALQRYTRAVGCDLVIACADRIDGQVIELTRGDL
jgi:hypothetical protein